jgi:putative ABC transport system permease protein
MPERDGLVERVIGAAVGCLPALGLAHAARALLFGVSAGDPATYGVVAAVLALVACAAAVRPAWRVWSLDCAETLRRG